MNKLTVTTLEGKVHCYDMRTFHHENGYAGVIENTGKSTIWGARHLPQNRDLFSIMGGDGNMTQYKYNYPTQRQIKDANDKVKGVPGYLEKLNDSPICQQPISGMDWSPDKLGQLCACGLDQTVKVVITTKLNLY